MIFILLIAATLTTSIAGYRYVAYPNRDTAIQAAYYLGQEVGMGSADARLTFEQRFRDDEDARLAYAHGMMSVEPASTDHTAIR
ncbi:hypothetical protein PQR02_02015 [Paraburkholderia sediminicola]